MSLINKMLKDLETRQTGGRAERPIFQDLQPVREARRHSRGGLLLGLGLVALVGGALYAWNRWGGTFFATAPMAVTSPATVVGVAADAGAPATPSIDPPHAAAATIGPAPSATVAPSGSALVVDAPVSANAAVGVAPKKPSASPRTTEAKLATSKPRSSGTRVVKTEQLTAPPHIERIEHRASADEVAENLYREAVSLQSQGNTIEAERRLKTLLGTSPQHVRARELLTGIQLDNGRWLEAQDTLEQGIAQVPGHVAFRTQLARLYLEHGSEGQALELLERSRTEGRSDAELVSFLAALYQRGGRHAEAAKSYREALGQRPQEGRWWLGLGISLEAQQDKADAQDAFRRALDSGRLNANLARYAEERLRALSVR